MRSFNRVISDDNNIASGSLFVNKLEVADWSLSSDTLNNKLDFEQNDTIYKIPSSDAQLYDSFTLPTGLTELSNNSYYYEQLDTVYLYIDLSFNITVNYTNLMFKLPIDAMHITLGNVEICDKDDNTIKSTMGTCKINNERTHVVIHSTLFNPSYIQNCNIKCFICYKKYTL